MAERKEIESALIKEACADAQIKAENMANGMNASLEYPYAISEDGFHGLNEYFGVANPKPPMFKKIQYKEGDTAKITYIPSRIRMSKSVNVIYRLSNK
ncbi:SIMPL domain-containing protein [Methylomonas koyamae]|uniref:SIMPL domain-containing protein n=1 Tax=Methylomonas koyamae TaxID=702114 RepID=UPI00210F8F44|nr:SIMPL domain-containing protein [Methylomonas koyamae]